MQYARVRLNLSLSFLYNIMDNITGENMYAEKKNGIKESENEVFGCERETIRMHDPKVFVA